MKAQGPRGFKFEEAWLLWDDCEEVIKDSLASVSSTKSGLNEVY